MRRLFTPTRVVIVAAVLGLFFMPRSWLAEMGDWVGRDTPCSTEREACDEACFWDHVDDRKLMGGCKGVPACVDCQRGCRDTAERCQQALDASGDQPWWKKWR